MDRKISKEVIARRKRKLTIKIGVAVVVAVTVFILLVQVFKSGIRYDDIVISEVDRGALNVSVAATGKVVPLYEEVITSPVSSKILSVYKKAGDSLQVNEPILELDLVAFNADVEKQRDELEIKRSKLEQQRISSESALADLEMQIKIDEMKLKRMAVLLRNERYLDSIGASTTDKIRQTELDFEVQTLQLEQLKLKYRNQQQTAAADLKAMELDCRIAEKNAALLQKTMGEAEVRSPRAATLTWINDQIGSNVAEGGQLAIVSDLNHFKIEGQIADSYADKISPGNPVEVKLGSLLLRGNVGSVAPSVKEGMINFIVLLDESDNSRLRSGLNVDLYIVNSIRDEVLRIDNRSYYTGSGEYDLWVIEGDKAIKRRVRLGESSFDKVEVIEGLQEGQRTIISDMSRYRKEKELVLRK